MPSIIKIKEDGYDITEGVTVDSYYWGLQEERRLQIEHEENQRARAIGFNNAQEQNEYNREWLEAHGSSMWESMAGS